MLTVAPVSIDIIDSATHPERPVASKSSTSVPRARPARSGWTASPPAGFARPKLTSVKVLGKWTWAPIPRT